MSFKKLPKEKQQHLLLVVFITVIAVAGLGFGLIRSQYRGLDQLAAKRIDAEKRLRLTREAVKHAAEIESDLQEVKRVLVASESDIASGDLYSWLNTTLRRFKAAYKVEIPQISPPSGVVEVNLLPNFPYKQASLLLSGTARYHDLGRFLADLENQFPHMRVLNLSLEQNPSPASGEEETLAFRMELAALVKPNAS